MITTFHMKTGEQLRRAQSELAAAGFIVKRPPRRYADKVGRLEVDHADQDLDRVLTITRSIDPTA